MRRFWILLLILLFYFLVFNKTSLAEISCDPSNCTNDPNQTDQRLNCLSEVTKKCEDQLQEAKKEEKTLNSQLSLIDGQMRVTELKIEETNLKIEKLKREILDLSARIDRIGVTLDSLSEVLLKRIVQTYKYSNSLSTLDLIFSSQNFADLLERLKYIQVAQSYDKKKLYELQATKLAYNDQKQDKQTRQVEAEKLFKDLENYKQQLVQQKRDKDALLKTTQNNEAIYQAKLQSALAEQAAIQSILQGGGNEVSEGTVSKGQVIGSYIIGKSACSSGSHLHFEIHRNNQIVNPADYLAGHSITWDNDPDGSFSFNGSWDWPILDPIFIEQGYGMTAWARQGWYGGNPHTGIDIFAGSNTSPITTVRSVHDGQLSHGGIACGGGTLRYKKVDHGDGLSSYYLHVL